METFSALLAICAGNSPVPGEFPTQRPVTRSCDVFFYLRLNKRLSKHSWGWWLETLSRPLWRHLNAAAASYDPPFTTSDGTGRPTPLQWWRLKSPAYRNANANANANVWSGADQRKHQTPRHWPLCARGIHRWPVNSPQHKWPVRGKCFHLWRHHAAHSLQPPRETFSRAGWSFHPELGCTSPKKIVVRHGRSVAMFRWQPCASSDTQTMTPLIAIYCLTRTLSFQVVSHDIRTSLWRPRY